MIKTGINTNYIKVIFVIIVITYYCYNVMNEVTFMGIYERKITKIGNSYGITLPQEILKEAGMNYGDSVEIVKVDDTISIQKKKDIKLPKGLSSDFFEVLERNTLPYARRRI